MPRKAQIFAWSIVVAGAMTLALGLLTCRIAAFPLFLVCISLALLGSTFKVKLPGLVGTSSPSFVLVLFAVGKMGWQETVIIAAAAGVMQCIWRPRQTPAKLQIAFNGAVFALAAALAHTVSHAMAGSAPYVLFMIAAIVFQMTNSMAVAIILSLLASESLRTVWQKCHFWSFPYHMAGGVFAAVWAQSDLTASFSLTVMGAITLYLMNMFYRGVVARMERIADAP